MREGCEALGQDLDDVVYQQLLSYLDLLAKWNKTYNLTAVRDVSDMVVRHLLDSLSIARFVDRGRVLDVGTGAGLPGIPLAIVYPDIDFHLLDSNSKKTRFLFQVKTTLGLDNMTVHHQRVESYQPGQLFDIVLSRAFASLSEMVSVCRHLVASDGIFLAMKGVYPVEEIASVEQSCSVESVKALRVPGLDEQRHLVCLKPQVK